MARYPFLSETVAHIREYGPSLEELNTSRVYQGARSNGKERILEAINDGKISDRPVVSESEALEETLAYIVARILVSCVGDFYLVRRYALSESKLMSERLKAEPVEFIKDLSVVLGIAATNEDTRPGHLRIHVSDFLRHSSGFREEDWKLVNQDLKNGYVELEQRRLIRLMEHALQVRFESELPLPVNNDLKKIYNAEINEFKALLGNIKKKYEIKDFGSLKMERLPGCMKQLLAMSQAGENLPHSGRFAITAFLHTIGLGPDAILKVFGKSPDFDPSIARYQIEHITGIHSGTEYVPPSCSKMKSYGLCYNPDNLCAKDWMNHPLTYYRVKGSDPQKARKGPGHKDKRKGFKK